MKQRAHDFKDLRSAQKSSSRRKDDKAERIVDTDDDGIARAGPRVEANISTMSNEIPREQENSKPAEQSDKCSTIQTTSADAAKGARKRRKKSKKSNASSFYASSDIEDPPSHESSLKVATSRILQACSELDASYKIAPRKGSLFSDMWEDVYKLPRALYLFFKWPIFLYVLWLVCTNSMIFIYHKAARQLEPVCDLPLIGHAIPFCSGPREAPPSTTINVTKVATSQEELNLVMKSVRQNFDLARDMVGHEFAVRDLRIRVAASNLYRRREIADELESLIREMKNTTKGLSRFTARVGKSIDTVVKFDAYAVRTLEGIAIRRQQVLTLPQKMISFLNPLSAFELTRAAQTDKDLRHVFLLTSTQIGVKVKTLLDTSYQLDLGLDNIQQILDRLKELAVVEVGDLPQMDVLRALWTRLARTDDYSRYKSHETLLTDITNFYKNASDAMRETVEALNRMESELREFRDGFTTPGLTLMEQPLEIMIELLRKSALRLELGKRRFDNAETGERAQGHSVSSGARTRTVTATLA